MGIEYLERIDDDGDCYGQVYDRPVYHLHPAIPEIHGAEPEAYGENQAQQGWQLAAPISIACKHVAMEEDKRYLQILPVVQPMAWIEFKDEGVVDSVTRPNPQVDGKEHCLQQKQRDSAPDLDFRQKTKGKDHSADRPLEGDAQTCSR